MKIRSILYRLVLSLSINVVAADFSAARTQDVSISPPVRQADGSMKMTLSGQSPAPQVLQTSPDLRTWTDLQTFTLAGIPVPFVDSQASASSIRYYRLKSLVTNPADLPSLADLANRVFVPGEGFDTIQYAPNGTLGFIFWKDSDLVLRERTTGGWTEQSVTSSGSLFQPNRTRQDFLFQPAAILLYDSNSRPHVFKLNGDATISHFARNGTTWSSPETIRNTQAGGSLAQLIGAVGPGNVFHLATITGGTSPRISYGTVQDGSWSWTHVTDIGAYPDMYLPWTYATRWFSLAVDSRNRAHLAFRPAFSISFHPQGYPRAYSELAYASNASGQWSIRTVHKPADISGEAGIGASIAIGPDDKPRIASWYNERADTGSSQWSRLYYHEQDASGNWVANTVTSRPDGYVAGDGEKGAGFAPYLRFDPKGRPHIVFSDHAGEHSWSSGQTEFTGQIRHAWWNGSQWLTERVFEQSSPLTQQMVYPAFAVSDSEITVTGLQRLTDWNWGVYPPTVNSTYRHVLVTRPLR